jgi:hypothetical protein
MLLPYINVRNWLRIGKRSDFQDMGDIHIWAHDVLFNANAVAGTDVTIQVFAWAEEIKVSGPTSELPLQADEYEETGPISGIASNIASLAGTAERLLPGPLRPFAKATEIGASAVSSIASLFGFTNVPVLDDVSAFKNLPFHAMASTQISCPFEKLTLDPKNELTIDNRVAGGNGTDELTIPYLVGKKNVWSLQNWASSDAPGAILTSINVTPSLSSGIDGGVYAPGDADPIYQPPMALVARNFRFWRGTMVYRFKFICSQYHRGRLAILWDPAHGTDADFNYTENYSRIVDISEEQEIVIKVPFMQPVPYLRTTWNPAAYNISTPTVAAAAYAEDSHNGRLIVKVLTKQTSPVASADILMYVETSMEDADFANPIDPNFNASTRTSYFEIQSHDSDDPVVADNIAKMAIQQNPNLHSIYNGEAVFSMRSLMRRRSYLRTYVFDSSTSSTIWQLNSTFNRRPSFYGYDPNGTSIANDIVGVGTSRFNFVSETTSNMFSPCFVGERGAVNLEFNLNLPGTAKDTLAAARYYSTVTVGSYKNIVFTTATGVDAKMDAAYRGARVLGKTGCALVNQRTQTGLQVQVPMYSRYRFLTNDINSRNLGSADDESDYDNVVVTTRAVSTSTLTTNPNEFTLDIYYSIGTDYQLLHFVNVPEAWVYGADVVPV